MFTELYTKVKKNYLKQNIFVFTIIKIIFIIKRHQILFLLME